MSYKPLPIGIDDFKKIRTGNYFYIDKTLLIKELLDMKGEVNLFTRPRRFGKTLNLSMLRYFFENTANDQKKLFASTKIMNCEPSYLAHMGQYPVISLTMKSMKQNSYEKAFYCLKEEISREYRRHDIVLEHLKYKVDQEKYLRFMEMEAMEEEYLSAILFLSACLNQYYNHPVIILIDEYDVPLGNAFFSGFYEKMISLIRSMFESALKSNENLAFAVITGCLRISKESIFTGLNNLQIMSVTSNYYAEHFGFTEQEVEQLLDSYKLSSNRDLLKKWYDGYLFGSQEVYNPWSVINYVQSCTKDIHAQPLPYWSNTSSNHIIHHLIEQADYSVKQEIEALIEGKSILKPIHEDITYEDIDSSQDNLWNFLFFTGYLKKVSEENVDEIRYIEMAIPNSEVRYIYKRTIMRWFEENVEQADLSELYHAVLNGEISKMEEYLNDCLMDTISFYDHQESFYHGFMAGLFKNVGKYIVISNRESGNGRPDLLLKSPSIRGKAVILEFKVAKNYSELDQKCEEAIKQIAEQKYEQALRQEGYQEISAYGIAFYRKDCKVRKGV